MKKVPFDESDNLCLKTFSFESETINSDNDVIRNLKDENGRLMKLLHEKDFEINKIKRLSEKQNIMKDNLSEGAASLKIIELSKKLREATAECEAWKTRYYQRDKEAKNAVYESREKKIDEKKTEESVNISMDTSNDLKSLKEKLKLSENKVLELLTSNQSLSRELKMAMKVLENELGDTNVDISRLLSNTGQWRGRAQKIVALKDKVEQLERQLKEESLASGYSQGSGATSLGMLHASSTSALINSPMTRQNNVLAKMQHERQMSADKVEEEHRRVLAEHERVKHACEGLKSRNKCLSEEIKSYKQQIKNMLDKTKNDDELIGSLIAQQDRLKCTLQTVLNSHESIAVSSDYDRTRAASQCRQDHETVDKLREIIANKDAEIRCLRASEVELRASGDEKLRERSSKDGLDVDFEEAKICVSALRSEVTQLRDLIKTEEMRLDALLQKNLSLSEDNSRLKQNYMQLEREVQRIAPNNKFKSKLKQIQSSETIADSSDLSLLLSPDVAVTRDTIESLQEEVTLRSDKIESLKNAVDMMSTAKKEDMKMLTDIIDQTRNQFLDSIKRIKSQCSNKDS